MRLFAALEPSASFRSALSELQERLRTAGVEGRYLDAANLHLTLAFIGEWGENVTAVLPAVIKPFSITLADVGIFERAKVLWAGVEPSAELNALAARVREHLQEAGIPFDPQAFFPHITLIRKPVLPDGTVLSEIRPRRAVMTVREVCLYQSVHEEKGMKYTVIGKTSPDAGEQNIKDRSIAR